MLRKRWRKIVGGMANLKFRHKLIITSVFCAVFVGVVSIAGQQLSFGEYTDFLYRQTSVSITLYCRQILFEMERMEVMSDRLSMDTNVQQSLLALSEEDTNNVRQPAARRQLERELYRYLEPGILNVTLQPSYGEAIHCGLEAIEVAPDIMRQGISQSADKGGAGFWMMSGRDDGSVLFFREVRKIDGPFFLKSMGYLVFLVDYGSLIQRAGAGLNLTDSWQMSVTGEEDVFVSTFSGAVPAFKSLARENGQRYGVHTVGGARFFLAGASLEDVDPQLEIVFGIPYDNMFFSITRTRIVSVAVILLAILISVLIAHWAVKSSNRRFERLVDKMSRFQVDGVKMVDVQTGGKGDELLLLDRQFDTLSVELKRAIEDNYIKQLLITQANLRSLEQQIHPHFLYNTLETISWFAKQNGEKNIPVIAEALGGLLRSSLSVKEDVVSLRQELAVLNNYIDIQMIRHAEMLYIEVDADEKALDTLIPKMSVQPLVENAIFHSMEENIDGCRINISARVAGGEVVVAVKNNGSYIDPDILVKLQRGTVVTNGHGLGLLNIDSRTRILFGEQYGLRFFNDNDCVTVEIHLPYGSQGGRERGLKQ